MSFYGYNQRVPAPRGEIQGADINWLGRELLALGIDVDNDAEPEVAKPCGECGGSGWLWLPFRGPVHCEACKHELGGEG